MKPGLVSPDFFYLLLVSLSESTLPILVYKKGEKSDPSNYRPISLTCVLCKILEHIVASSLVKHFTELDIFYEMQHGFREKRSCETQLISMN